MEEEKERKKNGENEGEKDQKKAIKGRQQTMKTYDNETKHFVTFSSSFLVFSAEIISHKDEREETKMREKK